MSEKNRKRTIRLLAVVFAVSTLLLLRTVFDKSVGEAVYEEAARIAAAPIEETVPTQPPSEAPSEVPSEAPSEAPETLPPTEPEMIWVPVPVEDDPVMEELAQINLEALREKNEDVIGWIQIPGTRINYPIVQGGDNQYYLNHTWDNRSSYVGSIFLESTNLSDFSEFHSILYGHNMADGSMFAGIHNYSYPSWAEKKPYIYLVTDEGIFRYEVYATYKADVTGDAYLLDMTQEDTQERFIRYTCEHSELDMQIVPAVTDRILTLSTCTGNYSHRRVVHARLAMMEVEK